MTVEKFIAALPENQLATTATWITGAMSRDTLESVSLDDLKLATEEVVKCIKVAPDVYPDAPENWRIYMRVYAR